MSRSALSNDGPSREQIEAFAKLTPEQRFEWWAEMIAFCHDLAPDEARQSWRRRKAEAHERWARSLRP